MCVARFVDCSELGGYDPSDPCNQTCMEEPVMCTMEFVDCSRLGGYDPRDPCNHTCMESEDSAATTGGDTGRDDSTDSTDSTDSRTDDSASGGSDSPTPARS